MNRCIVKKWMKIKKKCKEYIEETKVIDVKNIIQKKKRLKMIILERRNQGGEKEEFLEKRKSHAQRLFPRRDILCLEPQMTPR